MRPPVLLLRRETKESDAEKPVELLLGGVTQGEIEVVLKAAGFARAGDLHDQALLIGLPQGKAPKIHLITHTDGESQQPKMLPRLCQAVEASGYITRYDHDHWPCVQVLVRRPPTFRSERPGDVTIPEDQIVRRALCRLLVCFRPVTMQTTKQQIRRRTI